MNLIQLAHPRFPWQWSTKAQAFSLNNTTGSYTLWTVTGHIFIVSLWGEVTTAISSSHTSGGIRLVSGSDTTNYTNLAATMSSSAVNGSVFLENSGGNPVVTTRSAPSVGSSSGLKLHLAGPSTGNTTFTIEYRHTTTNTPESGAMLFNIVWSPLTASAGLV